MDRANRINDTDGNYKANGTSSDMEPSVGFDAVFDHVGGSGRYQWILLFITSIQVRLI